MYTSTLVHEGAHILLARQSGDCTDKLLIYVYKLFMSCYAIVQSYYAVVQSWQSRDEGSQVINNKVLSLLFILFLIHLSHIYHIFGVPL